MSVSTNGKVVIVQGSNGSTLLELPDENGEGEIWSREIGYALCVINKTCIVGRNALNEVTVEDYWMIVEESKEEETEDGDNIEENDESTEEEVDYGKSIGDKVDGDGAGGMNDESENGGEEAAVDGGRKRKISVKTEIEERLKLKERKDS